MKVKPTIAEQPAPLPEPAFDAQREKVSGFSLAQLIEASNSTLNDMANARTRAQLVVRMAIDSLPNDDDVDEAAALLDGLESLLKHRDDAYILGMGAIVAELVGHARKLAKVRP